MWLNKKNKSIKRTNSDEREFIIPVMVLCLGQGCGPSRGFVSHHVGCNYYKKWGDRLFVFFVFVVVFPGTSVCVCVFYPAWPRVLTSCWKERQKKTNVKSCSPPARPSLHCTVNHCIFPPLSSRYSHPPSTGASLRPVLRQTLADYRRSRNLLSEISSPVLQPVHNSHFTVPPVHV